MNRWLVWWESPLGEEFVEEPLDEQTAHARYAELKQQRVRSVSLALITDTAEHV